MERKDISDTMLLRVFMLDSIKFGFSPDATTERLPDTSEELRKAPMKRLEELVLEQMQAHAPQRPSKKPGA